MLTCSVIGHAEKYRISETQTVDGEIVSVSESCLIIRSQTSTGNPLYWIISEVANAVLPDVANYICLKIAGEDNQDICDAISDGINFITSAVSTVKSATKLIKNAISYTAERGVLKSGLQFATESFDFARNVKSTLEAYKKLSIVNWNDISSNYTAAQDNHYVGNVNIKNATNASFVVSLSKDGVYWYEKVIGPGKYIKFSFWDGYSKHNYGFIRGSNICDYQIFTDKVYKIKHNKISKQYYIQNL